MIILNYVIQQYSLNVSREDAFRVSKSSLSLLVAWDASSVFLCKTCYNHKFWAAMMIEKIETIGLEVYTKGAHQLLFVIQSDEFVHLILISPFLFFELVKILDTV